MNELAALILPRPQVYAPTPGHVTASRNLRVDNTVSDPRIAAAIDRFAQSLPPTAPAVATLRVRMTGRNTQPDAYRLTIQNQQIEIVADTPPGCFYGLQSLQQLVNASKTNAGISIPCGLIDDAPDFAHRGFMHDITRGKVPRVETLESIADRLALLKGNQLQLYIEHAFAWSFDTNLCQADNAICPDEVARLSRFCHDRFIELSPAVANLGHMGFLLSHPRYKHLAEIAPDKPWSQLTWPARARGFTLDCMNPAAIELVDQIWTDILKAFSGDTVNICGDEPWDLGAGKNNKTLGEQEKARAYVRHLEHVHRFVAARGKRVQFWSDVIRNHLDLIPPALRSSTVLHWGYDDRSDYEGTRHFTDLGLSTIVCPGTTGWKRIINAIDLAERNIHDFARAAKQHCADGIMTTDWGDHGHFNVLAGSWHGLAMGAAKAWNVNQPIGLDFDRAICRQFWGMPNTDFLQDLRAATSVGERTETWRYLWQLADPSVPNTPPEPGALELTSIAARAALDRLTSYAPTGTICDADFAEFTVALSFLDLFARHFSDAANGWTPAKACAWTRDLQQASGLYACTWSRRNKPSGLPDILAALSAIGPAIPGS